ncbi:MAG: DegT/DnrJ/EryC1/StrS family aminotransferase [Hyphomonadaceae bacterium]|nr:DegT/DnrJ/EryC1/StrS family aminotransferase [Hyphomonadaceae bacterium]
MTRIYLSAPHMGGQELENVREVFASNWIAPLGPALNAFEARLSAYTGVAHVTGLSSGTAALHLALRLSGVGPGDAVWSPSMTFVGGVAPILYQGAYPVFLDCDATTVIDLDLLEAELEIAAREGVLPKALITTDLYGLMPDQRRIEALRAKFGFIWISDSAEALGSRIDGVHAGKGADFVVLSFNGNKIITTSGGGALASDSPALIERAMFLATQAREPAPHYEHATWGYNYRLSNVCAAIGLGQMDVIDERVAQRRAVHDRYRAELGQLPGLTFMDEPSGHHANRWLTTITVDPATAGTDRETIRLALEAANIESRPLWKPMHMQPAFEQYRYIGGTVCEALFERGLCLPSCSSMTEVEMDRVLAALFDVLPAAGRS